jgi:hypothetical protein
MSPERIRQLLTERPFEAFTLYTGDGGTVDVLSPELSFLYPGGRTLRVLTPRKRKAANEDDFDEHRIDVFLITKVVTPVASRPNGRRRSNGH